MKYTRIVSILTAWLMFCVVGLKADEWIDTNGDGQNDTLQLDAFVVDGDDPETFDWSGFFQYQLDNGMDIDPSEYWTEYLGGYTSESTGSLGSRSSNNTYPYNQTTNTSCGISTSRNIISIMKNGSAPSEQIIAGRMTSVIGETATARFEETTTPGDGNHGMNKPTTQLNAALSPEGLKAERTSYDGNQQFINLMQNGANNGNVFAAGVIAQGSLTLDGNHIVVFRPYNDNGTLKVDVIDSGTDDSGNATVTIYSGSGLETLASVPVHADNASNEPLSGNIWIVSLKPSVP